MKKTFKMIAITTIMLIVLTSCGDKENQTTTTKATGIKAQTTVVNVTDKDGKEVTNTDGKAVTEVVTVANGTTKKVETTKATTSTTAPTTKAKVATTRATTTAKPTTTVPQTTARPTTTTATNKGMSHWVTDVSQNPYGYANAWGTIAQMENDCKAYAESMGMKYDSTLNLGNGHWITPKASYGFSSSQAFKNRLCGGDTVTSYQDSGYTFIRYLFVTMDNYKDGRCIGHEDNAEMYLKGNKDLIEVYIVVG